MKCTAKINRPVDVSMRRPGLPYGRVPEPIAQSPAPEALPLGVVTFLLTDVESSTRLWRTQPEAAGIMARHAQLIASAVARHGGVQPVEQGEGDSTVAAFALARDALAAALDAQQALAAERWPAGATIRVRMAVHTGESELRGEGAYGGAAIIRCARLRALARGGEVVVSAATREVVGDVLPPGAALLERATVQLEGFDRRERVYQLCHADLPAAVGPLRGARASLLGPWPTGLIGRTREREDVAALLARDRLVTITGSGGAGKTRLAHAVAEDVGARFADGVVWVELARVSEDSQVANAVAGACGVREVARVATTEVLARALADAELLVVLDNCEHVLAGCAAVVAALQAAGDAMRVLATGREALGVPGEVTWRIPALSLPPDDQRDPERLLEFDAVHLFVARAAAANPEFRLDAASAPAVAQICRRLDGIPLALELAAARVRAMTVQRLAVGLDDRFRLLTGGARTALARQRTLLASVEWSHDLLDESERIVFRRLGVFTGPFSLEAAEAVVAGADVDALDVLGLLARLVEKSLVQLVGDRYRLLETLRHHALQRAADAGELAAGRARHLEWFAQRPAAWGLPRIMATLPLIDEIEAEAPDLLAALEWSLGTDEGPAIGLLYALVPYWNARQRQGEMQAVAAKVLAGLEEGSARWLQALAPVAVELFFATDLRWAPAAERTLAALGDAVDPLVRGGIEFALSFSSAFAGRPDGLAALEHVSQLGRAAGSASLEIVPLLTLNSTLADKGALARVRPLIAWLDRHVPRDATMRFLLDDAHAYVSAFDGEFEAARGRVEPHLVDAGDLASCFMVANIALWTCDLPFARRAAATIERKVFPPGPFTTSVRWLRAVVPLLEDDLDSAARHLADDPAPWLMASASARIRYLGAEVALARDDVGRAAALLDETEPHLTGRTMHFYHVVVHLLRAEVARRGGEVRGAEGRAHEALELAAAHEIKLLVTDALETLAILAGDVGNHAQAARLLGAADSFRDRTGYRWRPHHRRATIDALRPQLAASHLAEGAALSLEEAVALARRGRGERRRPEFGWDSLTPTESRVVELVAAGLPNRAIASRLFVSLATVKTHLVHVYGKLDLRTRTELAAAATSRGVGRAPRTDPQAKS